MRSYPSALPALLSLLALGGACDGAPEHGARLGAASLFEAAVAPGGAPLLPLASLSIPANAELRVAPAWFVGALDGLGSDARLQVVVRARHADGAFTTLPLGPTPPGDGSHPLSTAGSAAVVRFDGPETAPLAARDVIALELLVATVPPAAPDSAPPGRARRAAAALFATPPARTADPTLLASLEAATLTAGGRLQLAVSVPVTLTAPTAPHTNAHVIVAVEADPSPRRGAAPADLERLDRAAQLVGVTPTDPGRPATRAGIPIRNLSALAIALTVTVPDHSQPLATPPRPERRRRGDPREQPTWEVPPQRDVTQNDR